jgi:hypothetical protein
VLSYGGRLRLGVLCAIVTRKFESFATYAEGLSKPENDMILALGSARPEA